MPKEKELKKVVFTFQDDSTLTLEGDKLETWMTICLGHSDYLLPGNETMILATGYGGLVQGFVPPEACKRGGWHGHA
jgi:hypothetical protein